MIGQMQIKVMTTGINYNLITEVKIYMTELINPMRRNTNICSITLTILLASTTLKYPYLKINNPQCGNSSITIEKPTSIHNQLTQAATRLSRQQHSAMSLHDSYPHTIFETRHILFRGQQMGSTTHHMHCSKRTTTTLYNGCSNETTPRQHD